MDFRLEIENLNDFRSNFFDQQVGLTVIEKLVAAGIVARFDVNSHHLFWASQVSGG